MYLIFSEIDEQVLKAFVHGDENLFNNYPELEESLVWVYFHSNIPEFNKVECWGPLMEAAAPTKNRKNEVEEVKEGPACNWDIPKPCEESCECCFPQMSLIPWSHQNFPIETTNSSGGREKNQGLQEQT